MNPVIDAPLFAVIDTAELPLNDCSSLNVTVFDVVDPLSTTPAHQSGKLVIVGERL